MMGELYKKFNGIWKVDSLGSFIDYFMNLPLGLQIVVGIVIFALVYITYLFVAALLSDKHI